jgi:pSer/pThr/pTyr-binding forkhead associated (FHA) protein
MSAFLVPLDSGLCLIPLDKAIVLIGRQADCDVSLTHSRKVSRKHCCIAQVNDAYVVRDLGSTNGVFVNGTRVRKETGLSVGDELAIGDVRFRLQTEASPSKSSRVHVNDPRGARPDVRSSAIAPPPSMDMPVAIPEVGQDFVVEASIAQMRPIRQRKSDDMSIPKFKPEDDVVPLASDSY